MSQFVRACACLVVVVLLSAVTFAQYPAQPTYPDCISGYTSTVNLPQATQRVRFSYGANSHVALDNIKFFCCGSPIGNEVYTYSGGATWSVTVRSTSGATLTSASGSLALGIYTYPCSYYAPPELGCHLRQFVSGEPFTNNTMIESAGEIDVSSLTTSGDTTLTLETVRTAFQAHVVRLMLNGAVQESDKCQDHISPQFVDLVVPAFNFPYIAEPDDRMITRLSASWDHDQYSSAYQRRSADVFPGVALGTRPQFLLTGYTEGLPANSRVWFRVVDPADPAPYVTGAEGDNVDPDGGTLYTSDGRSAPIGTAIYADTDETQSLTIALEGSDRYAGDNYKVIASVDPPGTSGRFPCEGANNCRSTAVITVWKRLYYEHAQMARAGAFLARDVTGGTDPCSATAPCELLLHSVAVNGTDVVTPGATLQLVGAAGGLWGGGGIVSEEVAVDIDTAAHGPAIQSVGTMAAPLFEVRLKDRPRNNYTGGLAGAASRYDAVLATNDTFAANMDGLEEVLEDANVEYKEAQAAAVVPYVGIMSDVDGSYLRRWLRSRRPPPDAPGLLPNHRAIIAADRFQMPIPAAPSAPPPTPCGTLFGYRVSGTRFSYVYVGTIQGATTGNIGTFYTVPGPRDQQATFNPICVGSTMPAVINDNADDHLYAATAHEAIHQFGVNPLNIGGHCSTNEYTGVYRCLMVFDYQNATNLQLANRVVNLHRGTDSEYATIRREQDPSQ